MPEREEKAGTANIAEATALILESPFFSFWWENEGNGTLVGSFFSTPLGEKKF